MLVLMFVEEVSHSDKAQLPILKVRVTPQGNTESGVVDVLLVNTSEFRIT